VFADHIGLLRAGLLIDSIAILGKQAEVDKGDISSLIKNEKG
jgi:hypothetical protein